ncbi:hypothetical protein [Anoxybacteroides amylolyticum]|uniref:Uncharacterized protein n=1 Tax=Anoxybacteroides amylolyticum TaxID=294699 RepID=A0A160F4A3_9BACL|nr:hypothetical protein [Anoxybacillus amylolyticus]ANB60483.1 hypothetical protein GFC30_2356 [Anoxybacillus amylolyticus]
MRWVKKEEVEKQLGEILQLMEQIETKMDDVIDNVVKEACAHQQAHIQKMEKQLDAVEQKMDEKEAQRFVPSKLHFV